MGVEYHGGDAAGQEPVEPEHGGDAYFLREIAGPLRILVSEHKWKDDEPTEEEALIVLGQTFILLST